jgi:hypothetical protein
MPRDGGWPPPQPVQRRARRAGHLPELLVLLAVLLGFWGLVTLRAIELARQAAVPL